ncbi:MAG: exodeoxyribonuclease VII large subunit [Desulfovibrio sp.]|nr:exodeoxyribonuclease VII large subunit [Desulfovibrio sp.]
MDSAGIYTVSALTGAVRDLLEGAFPFVWVRGQVVNLARPQSGHLYFSLRDEECSLAAVWFKGSRKDRERFDPLTGEVYEDGPRPAVSPENGQELICAGRLRLYGARGIYQLVVEMAQEAGLGRWHEEFERLRRRLADLGYFAPERKRPLPRLPSRVAVITAPGGAALQDFLRIAEGRGTGAVIRIHPSPVQGDAAPARLVAALEQVIADGWAQVVVFLRGGGSLEDLWAFNSALLARAIFSSPLPVLAGIGHEVDVTLADLTADARAATPTHAAQLLWPAREDLARLLRDRAAVLDGAGSRFLARRRESLSRLARDLSWRSPRRSLAVREERLSLAVRMLEAAMGRRLDFSGNRLRRLADGVRRLPQLLPTRRTALAVQAGRLRLAGPRCVHSLGGRLDLLALRLSSLDPHAPLERGYALVRREDGGLVRSAGAVRPREFLRVLVRDGEIPVRVQENAP